MIMIRLPYATFGPKIHKEIHDDSCLFEVVFVGVVVVVAAAAADNKINNNNNNHNNIDSSQDTSKCRIYATEFTRRSTMLHYCPID